MKGKRLSLGAATRVKVKVAGSGIVIGSPQKYIASVRLFTVQALPIWAHAHVSSCMNINAAQKKLKRWMEILHLDQIAPRCLMHWHHAKWERIPGCIALVIFSSNRTGHHPRSQHCWRVCAPFRTYLNKTWKLTQSLLWCMNTNVTSDRVEWQTGKYQFIMSFGLGQTISLWTYLMCSSPYRHDCIFSVEPSSWQWTYLHQTL